MQELYDSFIQQLKLTGALEYIAVFTGVISVWFSRRENILVYPVGLISTTIYVYLSIKIHLIGEASVNLYYSVMSIYGWWLWTKKDEESRYVVRVTRSNGKEWRQQIIFFLVSYLVLYLSLNFLKDVFAEGAIPWADALASASAYTGMWLMARKKVESWYWWIVTNIASIPLYFVKGFALTSVYFFILLLLAISGLSIWQARSRRPPTI